MLKLKAEIVKYKKLIYPKTMRHLTDVINLLRAQGYTEEFNLRSAFLESKTRGREIHPDHFQIDHSYRFEGESDPAFEAVVYAISGRKSETKGILVNSYRVCSDPMAGELAKEFPARRE